MDKTFDKYKKKKNTTHWSLEWLKKNKGGRRPKTPFIKQLIEDEDIENQITKTPK